MCEQGMQAQGAIKQLQKGAWTWNRTPTELMYIVLATVAVAPDTGRK